jgi:hypothetical protein
MRTKKLLVAGAGTGFKAWNVTAQMFVSITYGNYLEQKITLYFYLPLHKELPAPVLEFLGLFLRKTGSINSGTG